MADKPVTRRLKIYVNGQEVDATITNLRKNLAKFRNASNRAVEGSADWKKYNAEVARLEAELKQATTAQKAFRKDTQLTEKLIEDNTSAFTDFTSSISQFWQGLKSGDFLQAKDGFNGIKTGISGATKASLKFIATPIGAAIAALAGIGVAAKAWFDYNQKVVEALRTTTQITGLTDQAADQARIRAEALSEAFDTDFNQNLETAKRLAQQFGISYNEAFDLIEDGLVRGQKNNDEFFQSLKEYPTFFNSAKFSAEEFSRVIQTGYDLGIYSDKLPDAIKEADLAIKEQTKSTRDALVNAFGAAFTDDLLQRVRTGETTTKDALAEISAQAEKTGLNVQQNAQLTADLFKGAGEDAGGAIKIFGALNQALNENQRELTESEKITQEQVNATTELKQVSSALFATGDKGFGLLVDKAKLFGTKILIDILKAGVDVYNWVVDLNNESGTFSAIITTIGKVAGVQFRFLGTLIKAAVEGFKGLGTVLEGVFTLDPTKIKEGFKNTVDGIGDLLTDFKDKTTKDALDIADAFQGKNKLKKISLDDLSGSSTTGNNDGTNADNKKALEDHKIYLDEKLRLEKEAAKRSEEAELDRRKKKLDSEAAARKKEIEQLSISEEKKKELLDALDADTSAKKEILDTQAEDYKTYLEEKLKIEEEAALRSAEDEFKRKQLKVEQEAEARRKEIEALLISEQQKKELLDALEADTAAQKEIIDAEKEQAELDKKRAFEERKRALQEELDLQNAETALEKELLKAEADIEKQEAELEKLDLNAEEKAELLALLQEKEEATIAAIKEKHRKKEEQERQKALDK
ncbi:hypothetical protein CL622_08590, partial [archaeon]|nr:hypothetical protein [archaeon]